MPHKQPNYIASRHYVDVAERFLSAGFWNADMTTGDVQGTDGFCRILGLPRGEPFGIQQWAALLHPEDREEFRSLFPVAAMGVSVCREMRLAGRDRPPRWIRVIVDEPAAGGRIVGTVQDIAAERAAQAALYRERTRLNAFLAITGAIFWTRDAHGAVTGLHGWSRITGRAGDHALDESWLDAVHPDDRERAAALWSDVPTEAVSQELPCRLRYPDGAFRNVVARVAPVCREDGAVIEWLGVIEESWRREGPGARGDAMAFKPQQLRAARVMLGWPVEELARQTGLSTATIRRYETTGEHMKEATIAAIVAAFEKSGLVMTCSPAEIGIRFRVEDGF